MAIPEDPHRAPYKAFRIRVKHRPPTLPAMSSPHHISASSNLGYRRRSFSRESDFSSHLGGSRASSPSEHGSSSSEYENSKPFLPSLRDFCSGRLPSSDSALDARIRGLGIEQPLPPPRSFPSRHYPASSSSGSHHSAYQRTPTLARRSTSQSSLGDSPHSRRLELSGAADSDSEESCSSLQHEVYNRSCLLQTRRPRTYYRSQSFGSDMDYMPSAVSSRYTPTTQLVRPAFPPPNTRSPYDRSARKELYPQFNPASLDWEDYVEKAGRLNGTGPVMYTCRWEKEDGQPCKYTGKKQLAKRHVESVHLAKKPHVCPTCQKPFPQKTSLDIHIRSVHTFEKTILCDHCDTRFSDPARRHKHIRIAHPDKVVKKTRTKIEYDEIQHLLVK